MSLVKSAKLQQLCLKNTGILFTAIRNHWNKDYKPRPYPVSEEERAIAAKKYGLLPTEYEAYPNDGSGLGDYPNLPRISGESKDPYYPWDMPELKKNFGEPMHVDADMIGEDRYDVSAKLRFPGWMYWAQFLGVIFGTFGLYLYMEDKKMFIGQLPKQYPKEGTVHYTFESK